MFGGTSSYQGKDATLELKIIVRYEGLKATQYFSKYTSQSDVVLRDDLLTLKLPHPKRENTTFISHGCVECVWPLVRKNGVLHKQVITKTRPHNPDEQKAFGILLSELSISTLAAKEIYPDGSGKGWKNLKRQNPFTSERMEEGASAGLSRSRGDSHRVSTKLIEKHPIPLDSVAPKVTEAEAFLQDMRDSFRPHKIPKIEPVDVPLPPDPPPPTRLVRMGPPRSSSSRSSHLSSVSNTTNPPESVSKSSSLVKPPQAEFVVPPSHTKQNFLLPPKPPPVTTPTPDSKPIILPASVPDRPAPIKEMLRELQPLLSASQSLPELTQPERVPDTKPTPIPAPQRSLQVTNGTDSRPKVSDVPKIQRLTRESCDIRRQITADSVRDAAIISELRQLNAAFIPRPLKVGLADAATEERIRKLEQDLDNERKMRLEAEDVVRDIRRECKAPFVVPGLLDAFIKLSRLTTQASRLNGTIAKDNG